MDSVQNTAGACRDDPICPSLISMEQPVMPIISASATIESSADAVWSLLADFGNIEAWWPTDGKIRIERVECEGEGVDMVRHVHNFGVPGPVSERLDLIDPATMTLILSIVGDRPGGITAYVTTGTVTAEGPRRCRLDYRAHVTTEPGREERVEKNIRATWAEMFDGLGKAAARRGA